MPGDPAHSRQSPRNLCVQSLDLAARLRALRLAAGLSRQDLAERAGLSERSVRDIENGRRARVQDKTVMLLAEALGCDPAKLVVLPEPPPVDAAAVVQLRTPVATPDAIRRAWWPLIAAVFVVVTLLAAMGSVWYAVDRATWEIVDGDVVMRDALLRRQMWTVDQPHPVRLVQRSPWNDRTLLIGFYGHAEDGALVWRVNAITGQRVASYHLDESPVHAAFGAAILSQGQSFSCSSITPLDLDGDGGDELAIKFIHRKYYPTCLVAFDAEGNQLAHYVNRGHIINLHAEDLDGDGRDELLAFGTNNDLAYQGATVIYLEEGAWSGASVDPPDGPGAGPVGQITDGARHRLVLPSFGEPVMTRFQKVRLDAFSPWIFRLDDGSVRVMFSVGDQSTGGVSLVCDHTLRPLEADPTDGLTGLVRTWGDWTDEADPFPTRPWLDGWLEGARWSSLDSDAVVFGPVR